MNNKNTLYMSHSTPTIFTTLFIISISTNLFLNFSLLTLFLSVYLLYTTFATAATTTTKKKMAKSGDHQHYSTLEVEGESSGAREAKGKTPIMEAPLIGKGVSQESDGGAGVKKGVGIIDFVVRLLALAAALVATVAMGTTEQTLPFFTQFFQFQASYDDLPTFTYFVIANAIIAAYLVLSMPFSIVTIVRPLAKAPRLILVIFDTIALTLTISAASAAAAIVSLAHKGNTNTNWIAICQQFDSFCQRSSGAVVASFIAAVFFILLVILSTVALKSH